MTVRIYEGLNANLQPTFTDEEMECIRVCVANAPIPYDITLKKIPAEILDKIGQPKPRKGEPLEIPYYDLTPYGINE